jgi:hypothetical protein
MELIKSVKIRKLDPVSMQKGPTYEWCKGIPGKQITIYERKRGTEFGNHYHTGKDPSKNPERFLLLKGKALLKAYNGFIDERIEEVVDEYTEVLIYPGVFHSMRALTDVLFIEYRSTVYDSSNSDTFPAETYEEYVIQTLKRLNLL